ncbi:hypothetical protein AZ34_17460 [Hylemonella gracilis str. Niagara R]|uniref:UPF0276 protein AZ34_17460 n=1 Tax=Hylemonella gracilis str. Niagara R TaxID=1458275 RepID=A0A016XM84_9BURK|nr:hypothetical protein AZ34_17460 [Hylemonella gracilis str. Niagara R]
MAHTGLGFGLGLRTPHYNDFLNTRQPLDWLEIITDNFLVEGGKPLVMLERIRRDYPLAMHGVAMSIGAAAGVDLAYLRRVKALADRIEPLWVSDHLCWTGTPSQHLHDLYPLPYTDEAARHVIEQIRRAQDVLQRRLVLENVSSYIDFKHNASSEWQFLAHIAEAADCLLLVDVNNIYVSSVNHGFDPLTYLRALPAQRVQQIHLAGHSDNGGYIIDTHDHPVAQPVWDLYAQACHLYGSVATMIERDDDIPDLGVLMEELAIARHIASDVAREDVPVGTPTSPGASFSVQAEAPANSTEAPPLQQLQLGLASYILGDGATDSAPVSDWIRTPPGVDAGQRLGIYHNAYRARLAEVLAESFARTVLYMGSDRFEQDARAFAVSHPPMVRNLAHYGADFAAFLAALYPGNPELQELAQLDWDLRTTFDEADAPALDTQTAGAQEAALWLNRAQPLHPSLKLRSIRTNVAQIWHAIDRDLEVPAVAHREEPGTLLVWRKGLLPHFQTLEPDQAAFMLSLAQGRSIEATCADLAGTAVLPDPQRLAGWLQVWLEEGWLRAA